VEVVNLAEKFRQIDEFWKPRIAGEVNDTCIKLVRLHGEFVWHHHEAEDELFLVVAGKLRIDFRDRTLELHPGEFIIVPRGVEHRPVADEPVDVLLVEPKTTLNTGNVVTDLTHRDLKPI
jgi:mannose-6-phosphate isomerase-like protein (cupin superfamily)